MYVYQNRPTECHSYTHNGKGPQALGQELFIVCSMAISHLSSIGQLEEHQKRKGPFFWFQYVLRLFLWHKAAGQCTGHPVVPTLSEFQHLPHSGWLLMENIPATVASLIHLKTATKIISLKHKFKMDGGDDCTTM